MKNKNGSTMVISERTVNRSPAGAEESQLLQSLKRCGLIATNSDVPDLREMLTPSGMYSDDFLQRRLVLIRSVVEGSK